MDYKTIYEIWSNSPFFNDSTRQELADIKGDDKEIEERFYKNLEFGTGGLRGVIGAGTNRMNIYTVAKASAGLAQYIISNGEEAMKKGVAVSFDSRHFSPDFAKVTASTLAAYGIKVYLSDELRPVPMLSYSVRYFKAFAGVMVTASHNPPKYNGYKVYGEDGGQVTTEAAAAILSYIEQYDDVRTIKMIPYEQALETGLIEVFGANVDEAYTDMLTKLVIDKPSIDKNSDMSIVYTPLHGSGNKPVRRILDRVGFKNVHIVKEQELPDGAFPTVVTPNPEDPAALAMGIKLAKETDAAIVVGTDPDSDRVGVAARTIIDGEVTYKSFTGNQIGVMLLDYILNSKVEAGTLPENSFAVTTIVSTKLAGPICKAYGVELQEVLTGFKFIGERIKFDDEQGDKHFQFGFEESYGYLSGLDVRDKDAVVAVMLICGMAAQSKSMGETLFDRLERIYSKYGYGYEQAVSFTLEGKEGLEKIGNAMASMRSELEACKNIDDASKLIGGPAVKAVRDYKTSVRYDFASDSKDEIKLVKSNVLLYELGGECGMDWACVRPSGTEPKLKIYFGCYAKSGEAAMTRLEEVKAQMSAFVQGKL